MFQTRLCRKETKPNLVFLALGPSSPPKLGVVKDAMMIFKRGVGAFWEQEMLLSPYFSQALLEQILQRACV